MPNSTVAASQLDTVNQHTYNPVMTCQIATFYRFTPIEDAGNLRQRLIEAAKPLPRIRGTLLIAPEGYNGTLAAPEERDYYDEGSGR